MDGGAAIFDLDRTVLRRASGPVLENALAGEGLGTRWRLPGQAVVFRIYDMLGENVPAMAMARAGARAARGWPVEGVRRAGDAAVEPLMALVSPYAEPVMAEHREAGRALVLATTTPHDLVEPFAARLGFDEIVATRWSSAAGTYTGGVDGEFVWSLGKLAAMRRWAAGRGVDLEDCYAYSDSVYDVPLLAAVGHPVAVNPDPRLWVVASLARWPVRSFDAPPGVPKLAGVEPSDIIRLLVRPELFPYARFDMGPVDHIPAEGPAIIVANHRSYFDVVALGLTVFRRGRPLRFLAKREVFDAPVVGDLARALGGIRVDRGSGSDQPLREAAQALRAGELVGVLPQGTIPRGRDFYRPDLRGRTGAARLAAMTRAPVVPVGLWGTEAVWPRSARLPHLTNIVNPPLVRTRVGPPVHLGYTDAARDTEAIMEAIVDLLPPEAGDWHEPTGEEVARACPPLEAPSRGGARLHVVAPPGDAAGRGEPGSQSPGTLPTRARKPGKQSKSRKGAKGAKSTKPGKAARTLA